MAEMKQRLFGTLYLFQTVMETLSESLMIKMRVYLFLVVKCLEIADRLQSLFGGLYCVQTLTKILSENSMIKVLKK